MPNKQQALIKYLKTFATENRVELFEKIINQRTELLTIVLEDIYQAQNASAVLRTADCLGVSDVHIIESRNKYDVNPDVALGSNKWLNLYKYKQADACISELKQQGYQIAVTALHEDSIDLLDFKPNTKTALVFGTELTGVTDQVKKHADVFLKIPMYGFTESYNISVAAALGMYDLVHKLKTHKDFHLNALKKEQTMLKWLRKSIKNSKLLEEKFLAI